MLRLGAIRGLGNFREAGLRLRGSEIVRSFHASVIVEGRNKKKNQVVRLKKWKPHIFNRENENAKRLELREKIAGLNRSTPKVSKTLTRIAYNDTWFLRNPLMFLFTTGNAGYWGYSAYYMSTLSESDLIFSPVWTYAMAGLSSAMFFVCLWVNYRTVSRITISGVDGGKMKFETLYPFGVGMRVQNVSTGILKKRDDNAWMIFTTASPYGYYLLRRKKGYPDEQLMQLLNKGGAHVMAHSLRRAFPEANGLLRSRKVDQSAPVKS
ncbi:hypothetical protein NDN08_000582 [Rhodosorus marinus]|uniref:Transmembrane protein 186 n=1 Tax=Rhodosorus marinus TaxID=101924 RepID=A0AAV8US14_9RHOD|nr:hypothetical protein NDN08_000582 [Rhodosorus marinus]